MCVGGSLQPPSITDKVKEVFGLSEVNPNSKNLGPNEVGQEAIERITPNASSFDKAAPGAYPVRYLLDGPWEMPRSDKLRLPYSLQR